MKLAYLSLLSLILLILSACGGGSGGSGSSPANPPNPTVQLSGLAAEGNPLVNTMVEIRGANGETTSTTTDAGGKFSANISNLDYPLMVKAVGSNSYYSSIYNGNYINVTPFTTLALSLMLGTHPENVFSNFTSASLQNEAALDASALTITQKFSALVGLSNLNFFKQEFSPQAGDAYDDLLESLKQELITSGQTLTEIINEIIVENNPSPGCTAGQHMEGSTCVPSIRSCDIDNGEGEQIYTSNSWNACQVTECNTNYVQSGNLCLPASRACQTLPSNAEAGSETWNGSAWGACQISSCSEDYTLTNNTCVEDTAPVLTTLELTDPSIGNVRVNLFKKDLGVQTLVQMKEDSNSLVDGLIFDSTNIIKSFYAPRPHASGYYIDSVVAGSELIFQLSDVQEANAINIFKVNLTTGGEASKISIPSASGGYHINGNVWLAHRGTSIYYKAKVESHPTVYTAAIYKYDTSTSQASIVIPSTDYQDKFLKEKLSSGNPTYLRMVSASGYKFNLRAIDANDQVIELRELAQGEYQCVSGQLGDYNDCNPIYLEGRAIFVVRRVSDDQHKFLTTDGTIAGTSMVDIPFNYGGMGNMIKFNNKLVFNAIGMGPTYQRGVYAYSHSEGFHYLYHHDIGETISQITSTDTDVYWISSKTEYTYVNAQFNIVETVKVMTSKGTNATTSTLIPEVSAEFKTLFKMSAYERGPMIALKGHLIFNKSEEVNSVEQDHIKAYNLETQAITTIKHTAGRKHIYEKDPNHQRLILLEYNPDDNVPVGTMFILH